MFDPEFYPTPKPIINYMLQQHDVTGKVVLEPSAGKGDIVDVLIASGASQVLSYESNKDLGKIVGSKSKLIGNDFFECAKEDVSHIDFIVMNPPFSNADKHILHAWEIAPEGCTILALCNWETLNSPYTYSRKRLETLVKENGPQPENLGSVFSEAERKTSVEIGFIQMTKPVISDQSKFEGFYLDADEEFGGQDGLLPYNEVREIVMRYVGGLKAFDQFKEAADYLNRHIAPVGMGDKVGIEINYRKTTMDKLEFSKELQKRSWEWIIKKLNISKFVTSQVMADINKFVEQQTQVPFTQKNIYRMMDMIVQTRGQTMDRAIIEAFDHITSYHHENRYNLPGWKTNKHYLVGEKFIFPYLVKVGFSGEVSGEWRSDSKVDDINKVLCYLTGNSWDSMKTFYQMINSKENRPQWGQWCDWDFFEFKCFKKGTVHFKFKDRNVWALFNQRVANIKGFPLPEKF